MGDQALVKVESVSKKFCRNLKRSLWYGVQDISNELLGRANRGDGQLRRGEFWAVENVSFELRRGECLGLIGHNGAGKTTLLRMLSGLIKPDKGRIEMHGRIGTLIALGAGFHPLLTGRENIYINASVLGFNKRETDLCFDEIVEFSGLAEHLDTAVQYYSSGMYARLGFSIAAHLEPDILLVDEALAVGDIAFVVKCLNRVAELRRRGAGVIFVSHNEHQVRVAAQRCLVMHQGQLVIDTEPDQAYLSYGRLCKVENSYEYDSRGFVYDGPLRVVSLMIYSADGEHSGQTGERLDIRLDVRATEQCTDVQFELRFWNSNGLLLTTIRSADRYTSFNFEPGKFHLFVNIPVLFLAPGKYRIAGGFRRNGEILGGSWDIGYMDVRPPIEPWIGQGFVSMPAQISLVSDNEGP